MGAAAPMRRVTVAAAILAALMAAHETPAALRTAGLEASSSLAFSAAAIRHEVAAKGPGKLCPLQLCVEARRITPRYVCMCAARDAWGVSEQHQEGSAGGLNEEHWALAGAWRKSDWRPKVSHDSMSSASTPLSMGLGTLTLHLLCGAEVKRSSGGAAALVYISGGRAHGRGAQRRRPPGSRPASPWREGGAADAFDTSPRVPW